MTTQQITIRLPTERVAALRAAARAGHRSLAQQVEHELSCAASPIAPLEQPVGAVMSDGSIKAYET